MKSRFTYAFLVAATLVLVASGLVRGQEPSVPRVALLCAWQSASQELVESALVQKLTAMRTAAKLSRQALPIMQYALGSEEEQAYCREKLNIRLGNTPCVALVGVRVVAGAPVPGRVLERIDQVTQPEVAATRIFVRARNEIKAGRSVGVLVVWQSHHDLLPDAVAEVRRMQQQEPAVRQVERLVLARMASLGFQSRQLPVVQAPWPAASEVLERLQLHSGQFPAVALVTVDERDRPVEMLMHVDRVDAVAPESTADQVARQWGGRLAEVRPLQSYAVALKGSDGRYVRLDKPEGGALSCQKSKVGEDEQLVLVDLDGGVLASGHRVHVQSASGLYVEVEPGSTGALSARRREKPSVPFVIQRVGEAKAEPYIRAGDKVRLVTASGAAWSEETGAGHRLVCRPASSSSSAREVFTLEMR